MEPPDIDPLDDRPARRGAMSEDPSVERPGRWCPQPIPQDAVARTTLIDLLCTVGEERLVTVTAPAGYGKSTLLAQWVARDTRPAAWLTVDRFDNDPAALLSGIRSALVRTGMISDSDRSPYPATSRTALSEGVSMVAREIDPTVNGLLVLDNTDVLVSLESRAVLVELLEQIPRNLLLVVASRFDIGFPLPILRARRELVRVSTADLSLTQADVSAMAAQAGVDLVDSTVKELLEHTEGWPIAVYLALLALQTPGRSSRAFHVCGNDEFLATYMQGEVLANLSDAQVAFLVRTSILGALAGPLCEAVLADPDAPKVLESLVASQLLLMPVDDHRRWYRTHQLLRDLLTAELRRREPELESVLHSRAAGWYHDHGNTDEAIGHAMAAGDVELASRLVFGSARRRFAEGAIDTVHSWIEWFGEDDRTAQHPEIALLATLLYSQTGDAPSARHWAAVVKASSEDGSGLEPLYRLASAMMCPVGIEQMYSDARAAQDGLTAASDWYPIAATLTALATLVQGDVASADLLFKTAAESAGRVMATGSEIFSLAARSRTAASLADRVGSERLATRSLRLVEEHRLERATASVLAYVAAARAAVRRGEPAEAGRLMVQSTAMRPSLSAAAPVMSVYTLLEMAEAEVELANIGGARQALREATDIVHQCRSLGPLEDRLVELKERIASAPVGNVGLSTLSNAELRVLPLLATHLSFPEIGERLFVSRHTVKSHAMSIYRKLGVSSRSEAVDVARSMHLLSDQ